MNGRVEKNNNVMEKYIGRRKYLINDNGIRLIDICIENNVFVTTTKFTHKDIHIFTR